MYPTDTIESSMSKAIQEASEEYLNSIKDKGEAYVEGVKLTIMARGFMNHLQSFAAVAELNDDSHELLREISTMWVASIMQLYFTSHGMDNDDGKAAMKHGEDMLKQLTKVAHAERNAAASQKPDSVH